MKLIPQEIKNKIPKLYETEEQNDPIVLRRMDLATQTHKHLAS